MSQYNKCCYIEIANINKVKNNVNKISKEKIIESKELLANTALKQLEGSADIQELVNIKVEFGYVYSRGDEYEVLFKIITDKKTIYFAAQQGRLMRLGDTFNEKVFQEYNQTNDSTSW